MKMKPEETFGASVSPRVALVSILGFWAFYFAMNTLRMLQEPWAEQLNAMQKRGVVVLIGMALSILLYLMLRPLDRRSLGQRIAAAFIASAPIAFAYAAVNYAAFYLVNPSDHVMQEIARRPEKVSSPLMMVTNSALDWYFFIVAWAVLYIALSYAHAVRDAERRAAAFRSAARDAELRALRYQVNPHFLFNTLNSLSSLVLSNRREGAEQMILNLSTFFRTSLTADPAEDITLAEEIRLQRLYLDIEAVRFPDRLVVEIDIPEALQSACVPCLILQPLIENAIKYGVSRSRRPVTLRIWARQEQDALIIMVEDDGDAAARESGINLRAQAEPVEAGSVTLRQAQGERAEAPPMPGSPDGTGTGLRNVRDRLAARFGDRARLEAKPLPDRGFAVSLTLPIIRNGC